MKKLSILLPLLISIAFAQIPIEEKLFIKKFFNKKQCDQIIDKTYYEICYNYKAKGANYVYYVLDGSKVNKGNIKERPRFYDELKLPRNYRTKHSDYTRNQYKMDRGHLANDASFDWSEKSLKSTYSMANVIPQYKNINRYTWIKAEKLERLVATKLGKVSVLNSVIYSNSPKTIGRNKVAVPKAFWKMIFNKEKNYERCFYYENIIGLKTRGDKLKDHEVECNSLY
ncbi:DNA/RNA non-specific endonuclease [Sulfurimonas sp.]|uniref:DNA/RNA non-specific endonuclease n=1 Tax=Sulfurimonas sp. TaxID=2022749 RepID=UPI0035660CFA